MLLLLKSLFYLLGSPCCPHILQRKLFLMFVCLYNNHSTISTYSDDYPELILTHEVDLHSFLRWLNDNVWIIPHYPLLIYWISSYIINIYTHKIFLKLNYRWSSHLINAEVFTHALRNNFDRYSVDFFSISSV